MKLFQHYEKNDKGQDYVVGDIHGHFSALEKLLEKIKFDKTKDRLFSVGDLVDRGPESALCLDYIMQPWFIPIAGNHEYIIIKAGLKRYEEAYPEGRNNPDGNQWFFKLEDEQRLKYIETFKKLPVVIQVGDIGIVHAYPLDTWKETVKAAKKCEYDLIDKITRSRNYALQVRDDKFIQPPTIEGIKAVVVGHTIFKEATKRSNVLFLDTGYFLKGSLTIARLEDLSIVGIENYAL